MSDAPNPQRQPRLYWNRLVQLKAAAICIRLHRNRLARWMHAVELIKAVGSGGGIAGWVVWRDYPLLWSGIIAASQFLDATKHVFPFARLHKAASDLTVALELLSIDAEAEWEVIYAGKIPNDGIAERRARLAKLQLEAEHKYFPEGFVPSERFVTLAIGQAKDYFLRMHGDIHYPGTAVATDKSDVNGDHAQ